MTPNSQARVSIIGLGPGASDLLTPRALRILTEADVVVGYGLYIEMVRAWIPEARCVASPIGDERLRAAAALRVAAEGRHVAVVSSGDAGIYGMGGLVLELAADPAYAGVAIETVPGITAAQAAAAAVGAPLMLDFATISLSDRLIPWEQIERRLDGATRAGFVLALYNPTSGRRSHRFVRALEVIAAYRPPATPCAVVRNAARPEQQERLVTLAELATEAAGVDMLTVLIIGNESTHVLGGRMVTPRGYGIETPGIIDTLAPAIDALSAELRATLNG
jgi:precorrin-3B C17-methyltransferase